MDIYRFIDGDPTLPPFCAICFEWLPTEDLCYQDSDGNIWDVCIPCALEEQEMIWYCFNTGCESPWD